LELLINNTPTDDVEFILSDNASSDGTKEFLESLELPHKKIIVYGQNTGYQIPHNEALKVANGKFFVILNNDIFIKQHDWLERLLITFKMDENLAIAGFDGSPISISSNGNGFVGSELEYIEGSCIVGKTALFRKYGLFSPAYKLFYFEDADLSLRYRQMGYNIKTVRCNFNHVRAKTANTLNRKFVQGVMDYNKGVFMRRWDSYLRNRKFFNHIKVRCCSAGIGDILAMTPVIESLRKDHPKAIFWLETNHPEVFENNPHVDQVISEGKSLVQGLDREIDLMPSSGLNKKQVFSAKRLLCLSGEIQAATKIESPYPQIYCTRRELDFGAKVVKELRQGAERPVVGLSLLMDRVQWQGRNWRPNETKKLVRALNRLGVATIEFGKNVPSTGLATLDLVDRITLRQFFAIMANLNECKVSESGKMIQDFFIGIDSLGMHVAQAFRVPSFILFGATDPIAFVVDFSMETPVRNEKLSCLGCYNRKGDPGYNKCALGTEECMDITAEYVIAHILGEIDGRRNSLHYLQNLIEGR
jgi:GT2 family glycosyltransferase